MHVALHLSILSASLLPYHNWAGGDKDMKRQALAATTIIVALTAAMLFAGVASAQQPMTATAHNTYGTDGAGPHALGHTPATVNGASPDCCHHYGGHCHQHGGCGHHYGGCCHHKRC